MIWSEFIPAEAHVRPCACRFDDGPLYTLEWHRKHKVHHLATFPAVTDDRSTVHALDQAIKRASLIEEEM